MTYPIIEISSGTIRVRMAAGRAVRTATVWCVVDFSAFDEPLGIEILGFKEQLGNEPPVWGGGDQDPQDQAPLWTYHAKGDAFYLRFKKDRAPKQREVRGSASLDRDGSLVCLTVDPAA